MTDILSLIDSPEDLKELDLNSLKQLSGEIREFLIKNVLKTGGHLASNLGVVELTIALHKVFSAPHDDIVWDVGHQSYVHKIICGRRNKFSSLRQMGGLSGFPKPSESEYDTFETGHSGTSLSVALGFACSADLEGENKEVIAVIGDASFSGGLPMEAMNCISQFKKKVIIILNDNQMSIDKNRGAFARYLNRVRTKPSYYNAKRETTEFLDKLPIFGKGLKKIVKRAKGYLKYMLTPGVVFEQLGYKYLGPIDGHDIKLLCDTFEEAKKTGQSVVVHVCTTKGKGYEEAEKAPSLFHGVSAGGGGGKSFTTQFGESILAIAEKNEKVISICPSMVASCGLQKFRDKYKERLFDTGIAEGHAVTFAAGMAQKGFVPVVSVYSSFLQRAYDSVLHDIALGKRHVVLSVDRAGIVGEDGETHQGIYDISFLSHIPGMAVLAPCDNEMLHQMLTYATCEHHGPIAIRFPKGTPERSFGGKFEFGKAEKIKEGSKVTLAALGSMVSHAMGCAEILENDGIDAEVIDIRCAAPVDFEKIFESARKTGVLITIEDNILSGGVGESIAAKAATMGETFKVITKAFPDKFISAGKRGELFELYRLSAKTLAEDIKVILNETKA